MFGFFSWSTTNIISSFKILFRFLKKLFYCWKIAIFRKLLCKHEQSFRQQIFEKLGKLNLNVEENATKELFIKKQKTPVAVITDEVDKIQQLMMNYYGAGHGSDPSSQVHHSLLRLVVKSHVTLRSNNSLLQIIKVIFWARSRWVQHFSWKLGCL